MLQGLKGIACDVLKRIEPQDLLLVRILLLMSLLCLARKRNLLNLRVKLIAMLTRRWCLKLKIQIILI